MSAGTIYGLITCAVVLMAWISDNHVCQKLAMLLLASWAADNMAVDWMGFDRAPLLIPSLDAIAAILVAAIGFANRSFIALVVFVIYASVGATHMVAFLLHEQDTYAYYALLNVLFLAQLVTVGGTSAWLGLRHWVPRGSQRFRSDPARR